MNQRIVSNGADPELRNLTDYAVASFCHTNVGALPCGAHDKGGLVLNTQTRKLFSLATLGAILVAGAACSTSPGHITPTPTPVGGLNGARLYAANISKPSVTVYQGPFSASSTAAGSIALSVASSGVAVDPTDATAVYVSTSTTGTGQILKFARPNPNGSAPSLTIGGFQGPGAINFDSNGNLFVPDQLLHNVSVINHPITGVSTPTPVITSGLSLPSCVAFDASNTLYVLDIQNGGTLYAYTPPYTGAPISTNMGMVGNPEVCAYDRAANTLFIGSINAGLTIQGYTLPLTANEVPSVTINTSVCCPGAITFDSSGDAFISVGIDVANAIAVAIPPFTNQSSFIFPSADYVKQFAIGP